MGGRRRHQKNPLLARIIFVSIVFHVIALPVLAHFGAFKKLQEQFVALNVTVVPPPPLPEEKRQEAKKPKAEHRQASAGKRSSSSAAHPHAPHQNLNMPK